MRPWLELIRLPAVFTAPADVLAGLALAALAGAVVAPVTVALLLAASMCIYCAGMAANDLFDAEIDARERPGRPIPSGRVSKGGAWALVLLLQGIALSIGVLVGPASLTAIGLTILATYLYDAGTKDGPAGPLVMGLCRYGNAIIGLSVIGFDMPSALLAVPVTTGLFVAALTLTSRHEVEGATAATLRLPFGLMLVGAVAPAMWIIGGPLPVTWAAAAVVVPVVWLIGPMRRALANPGPGPVKGVVMAGIFAIAMINGVLALGAGAYITAAVIVGLLVPGRLVGRWFYAT